MKPARRQFLTVGGAAALSAAVALTLAWGGTSQAATGIPGDLACGRPTTADNAADSSHPATNATDCSTSTAWQSQAVKPTALQVDLGGTQAVDHVTIVWGTGYGTSFKIRTSPDGTTWHTQVSVTGGTGGTQTVALPAGVSTRWIQLYGQQYSSSANGFTVDEFEVFGGATTPPTTPSTQPTTSPSTQPSSQPSSRPSTTPSSTPSSKPSTTPSSSPSSTPATSTWTGQFTGFNTPTWKTAWGEAATGTWGFPDLTETTDSSAPGNGSALSVFYGQGSSANSCTDCPNVGGGQFYTDFTALGRPDFVNATTLDLKYAVKFDAGFDFGKAGKLPGLYGGTIGEESGGDHGNGWSTRYMWRAEKASPSQGEIYLYTPTNSGPTGYGVDYLGQWNWAGDGKWHTIEQQVNRVTGNVTVWYDGVQALQMSGQATGISGIPFSGVFFSTFFGGHDTTWGPSKSEHAYFADFSVSTSVQH